MSSFEEMSRSVNSPEFTGRRFCLFRRHGFSEEEAAAWTQGFRWSEEQRILEVALLWRAAALCPLQDAVIWNRHFFCSPEDARPWIERGYGPHLAMLLIDLKERAPFVDGPVALTSDWLDPAITPEIAALCMAARVGPLEVIERAKMATQDELIAGLRTMAALSD